MEQKIDKVQRAKDVYEMTQTRGYAYVHDFISSEIAKLSSINYIKDEETTAMIVQIRKAQTHCKALRSVFNAIDEWIKEGKNEINNGGKR